MVDPLESSSHALFLRALTSRLGEIRDVASLWSVPTLPEASYLASLRRVRDDCHEWTASDVFRALNAADGCSILVKNEDDCLSVPLQHGLPQWSWPHYPRAPWLRYVCPVLESLLCSCYEDWLESALCMTHAMLEAMNGMFALAKDCQEEDLSNPETEEKLPCEDAKESCKEPRSSDDNGVLTEEELDAKRIRHFAALEALEFRRHAEPLLAALACASQCPSPRTRLSAALALKILREALNSYSQLLR